MGSSSEHSAFGPVRHPGGRPRGRRLVRRIRRGGGGGRGAAGARHRHRRLGAAAGRVLRRVGRQAHLRPALALRRDRLRQLARSGGRVRRATPRTPPGARGDGRATTRRRDHRAARRRRARPAPLDPAACASAASRPVGATASLRRARGARRRGAAAARRWAPWSSTSSCRWRPAAVASYYLIATAEASSNLARYDGTLYGLRVGASREGHEAVARATRAAGLGREVQRRVLMGSFALSAGYADAYAGPRRPRAAAHRRRAGRRAARRRRAAGADGADRRLAVGASGSTTRWRCTSRTSPPASPTWRACRR
jgi:hypothetical protein